MYYKLLIFFALYFVSNIKLNALQYQGKIEKGSLVFVFDTTGSMYYDLIQLRDAARKIASKFETLHHIPIENYILVEFNDPQVKSAMVTTNKNEIIKKLDSIYIVPGSGGDCPEQCFAGIEKGLEAANDKSYLFVFTDASSKQLNKMNSIKRLVQKKRIPIYFFVAGSCNTDKDNLKYREIAESSNGLFFDVQRKEIDPILSNFASIINEKATIAKTIKSTTGKKTQNELKVDNAIKEFTLTFIGSKPLIKILDPHNKEYRNYNTLTSLENVKMFQVRNPEPGAWKIEVSANSAYSGQISVISDLIFKYGFSLVPPNTIYNTAYHPLLGHKNYLSISTTSNSLISHLDKVTLLYGNQKLVLTLSKISITSTAETIYSTELFTLPNKPFKIYLYGRDTKNNEIARLLSPEISGTIATMPEMGKSHDLMKVQEGDPIYLLCEVITLEPVEIKWFKQGSSQVLKQISAKQSEVLNYTIEYAEEKNAGTYICKAKNKLGESDMNTKVEILISPLRVQVPEAVYNVREGSLYQILVCIVSPASNRKVHWLFNDGYNLPTMAKMNGDNLILNNLSRSMQGKYTCVATKNGEQKFASITLNVHYPPKILKLTQNGNQILSVNPIVLHNDNKITIICDASGNPTPKIVWKMENKVVSQSNVLNIERSNAANMKDYTCLTQNSEGTDTKSIRFKTIYPPNLRKHYVQSYAAKLNKQFTLECPVDNAEIITWSFNNHNLIPKFIRNNQLFIESMSEQTKGVYKCKGSNIAGPSEEAQIFVDAVFPPIILKITQNGNVINTVDPIVLQNDNKITFVCVANGHPTPKTVWKMENKEVYQSNVLNIERSNAANMKDYTCLTQNSEGTDTKSIRFKTIYPPNLRKYYVKSYAAKLNKQFTLECPVDNAESITWSFNNRNLIPKLIRNNKLFIESMSVQTKGVYKCKGSNIAGPSEEAQIFVDAVFPPNILKITQNGHEINTVDPIVLHNENKITIVCDASGHPTPKTVWLQEKNEISRSNVLTIERSNAANMKDYTCLTYNSEGEDVKSIRFNKIYPPTLQRNYANSYTAKLNTQFTLECPVDDAEVITWSFNNRNLVPKFIRNNKLFIESMSEQTKGVYKCKGWNIAGPSEEAQIFVDAVFPPIISRITQNGNEISTAYPIELLNDITVRLSCEVTGNPTPNLVWKLENTIISTNSKIDVQRATVEPMKPYICIAENDQGKVQKSIFFKVIYPPTIRSDYLDYYKVPINKYFKLECPVNEAIDISWAFNDRAILTNSIQNEQLIIPKMTFNTNGTYTCIATNKAGSTKVKFFIDVVYPPKVIRLIDDGNEMAIPYQTIELSNENLKQIVCVASGNPRPNVTWMLEDRIVSYSNEFLVKRSEIVNLKPYTCVTTNNQGTANSSILFNTIYAPALKSNFKNHHLIKIDNNFTLECPVNDQSNIKWTFNHQNLNPEFNQNNKLFIKKMSFQTNGTYKCVASNKAGSVDAKFLIDIVFPPTILKILQNGVEIKPNTVPIELFNENENVFICKTIGYPVPKIAWKYGDIFVSDSDKYLVRRSNVKNMKPYTCVATNSQGNANTSVLFKTIYKPKVLPNSQDFFQIKVHETLKLKCPVDTSDTVSWKFNNNQINQNSIQHKELIIEPITYNMNGSYKCLATNKAGSTEVEMFVELLYPPQIVIATMPATMYSIDSNIRPNKLSLNEGDTISKFTCTSDANPTPEIKWYFNGQILSENSTFDINSVVQSNTGMYTCEAKNVYGSLDIKIYIHVGKPTFTSSGFEQVFGKAIDPNRRIKKLRDAYPLPDKYLNADFKKHIVVREKEKISLECEVSGQTKTVWYKNNNKLHFTSNEMIFEEALIDDTGVYKCTQSHRKGEINIIYFVDVLKKPEILVTEMEIPFNVPIFTTLKLPCKVSGNYLPLIEWVHPDGSVLVTNKRLLIANNQTIINQLLVNREKIFVKMDGRILKEKFVTRFDEYGFIEYDNFVQTLYYVKKNVTADTDSVSYKCVIRSVQQNSIIQSEDVSINVLIPPRLESEKVKQIQTIEVPPNISFYIICPLQGNPKPSIKLTSSHKDLQTNNSLTEITKRGYPALNLNLTKLDQTEVYKCEGNNSQGHIEIIFNIKVVNKSNNLIDPEFLNENIVENIEIERGGFKQVQCPFEDKTEVFWSLGRARNYLRDRFYNISTDHDHNLFCSTDRSPDSFGKIFKIIVVEQPKVKSPSQPIISLYIEDTFTLSCDVIAGKPEPTITWIKYHSGIETIMKSENNIIINGTNLIINNIQLSDSGYYKCRALNKIGEDEIIVTLNVKDRIKWLPWEDWSPCSTTCGEGSQSRHRKCKRVDISEANCTQINEEKRECELKKCPIDGEWSPFLDWSPCSATCVHEKSLNTPIQIRKRLCNSPYPQYGGKYCQGSELEKRDCNPGFCPIDGNWDKWYETSQCSVTCGPGIKSIERKYIPAKYGGKDINGVGHNSTDKKNIACNLMLCSSRIPFIPLN